MKTTFLIIIVSLLKVAIVTAQPSSVNVGHAESHKASKISLSLGSATSQTENPGNLPFAHELGHRIFLGASGEVINIQSRSQKRVRIINAKGEDLGEVNGEGTLRMRLGAFPTGEYTLWVECPKGFCIERLTIM